MAEPSRNGSCFSHWTCDGNLVFRDIVLCYIVNGYNVTTVSTTEDCSRQYCTLIGILLRCYSRPSRTRPSYLESSLNGGRKMSNLQCLTNVSVRTCTGARRFPGLINCTSVDFFHPWPRQALISVAARFLDDVELGEASVKDSLAVHMAEEHLSVTKV